MEINGHFYIVVFFHFPIRLFFGTSDVRVARRTRIVSRADGIETDRDLVLLFTYKTSRGTFELFAREIAACVLYYTYEFSRGKSACIIYTIISPRYGCLLL